MKTFVEQFGPWALVTGASSGIGEAFARRLAEIGMSLVLVARREDRLRRLAEELQSKHSVSTRVVPVDLSRADFLPTIEQATNDLQVGLLVNNAGFANTGKFLDNDLGSELALIHRTHRNSWGNEVTTSSTAMLMVQGYDRPALQKCKRIWEQCAAGFLACRQGSQRQSNTQRFAPVEPRQ